MKENELLMETVVEFIQEQSQCKTTYALEQKTQQNEQMCIWLKEIGTFHRFTVHITNIQQKSTEQFQLEQRIFKSIQTHQKNYLQNSTEWQTASPPPSDQNSTESK